MIRSLALTCGVIALAGCSLAPHYQRTALPVPPTWPTGDAYLVPETASLPHYNYRQIFADPRLVALIEAALVGNQDVARAVANIAAARAQYRIQRAERLPGLDASVGYRDTNGSATNGTYSADLGVTAYELDLFGRVRSLTDAAKARYFASQSAAQATRLALISDVADVWLEHAADQSLLTIARDTVSTQSMVVNLTRQRLEGGIAGRGDLRQAELTLHTAESDVARKTAAVAQDVNALQLLVGAPIDPHFLADSIEDAGAKLGDIPAGIDSAILLRRPDVLEAEYNLRAANADIGAARAELFPHISLTGALGFLSNALGALFTGGAFSIATSAEAAYPIFRAGAGKQTVDLSKAQRDALLATYRKSIQSAFRDVSDALARRGTIEAQHAADLANRDAAKDNAALAEMRYRGGVESYLTSLTAQQAYYAARKTLVATELARANNRTQIYRALGGDDLLSPEAIVKRGE